MKVTIKELIEDSAKSVAFPKIALRILKLFEDDNLSAYHLAKAISLDPVLTAYILKMANSAYYNFAGKIKTLSDAIALIGFGEVRKIVVMASTKSAFSPSDFFDNLLWQHSLAVAIATSELNLELKLTDEGSAYIMGLLHDIGKVIFKKSSKLNYIDILKEAYNNDLFSQNLEDKMYGYNHADVGSNLLETWNFDQEIIDAVAFHHVKFTELNHSFLKCSAMVNLADAFANFMGIGRKDPMHDLTLLNNFNSAKFLNFYKEDYGEIISRIHKKFFILTQTFGGG